MERYGLRIIIGKEKSNLETVIIDPLFQKFCTRKDSELVHYPNSDILFEIEKGIIIHKGRW